MGLHEQTDEHDKAGIIVRALIDVFRMLEEKYGENGYEVAVSFIEIYNEKVYDLFSDSREAQRGVYKPSDIERVEVASMEEAIQLLTIANGGRHTRPTKFNPTSSRSHAVFTIHLKIKTAERKTISALHLVDLAGSEGAKRTGHEGVALSEGNYINQGLLAVGKVLKAMSSGLKVVPYRDSVLTHVLQDSLNLNSYITLLVCVAPTEASGTISTLNFAHGAKLLKTTPQMNQIMKELTKGKTPSKLYQQPLRVKNLNKTPSKRPFPSMLSTVKKPVRHTICTPSKQQRLDFAKPLNSTCVIEPRLPAVQDFFHPDNFSQAIEMIRDVPEPAQRESIDSIASTNMNISTSTQLLSARPSTEAPLQVILTPQSEKQSMNPIAPTLTISPLMRRIENLEAMLNEKFQTLYNASLAGDQVQTMKHELQMMVRQELAHVSIMPNTTTFSARDINVEQGPAPLRNPYAIALDETNINTTTATTNTARPDVFKQPQPLVKAPRRRFTVAPEQPLRRSVRLSIMPVPPLYKALTLPQEMPPPSPPKKKPKSMSKVMEAYFNNGATGGKVSKKTHKEAVFEILNKGDIKDLQTLPRIGKKTAHVIFTARSIKGKFNSWKEIKGLPCWKGKMWDSFLTDNFIN